MHVWLSHARKLFVALPVCRILAHRGGVEAWFYRRLTYHPLFDWLCLALTASDFLPFSSPTSKRRLLCLSTWYKMRTHGTKCRKGLFFFVPANHFPRMKSLGKKHCKTTTDTTRGKWQMSFVDFIRHMMIFNDVTSAFLEAPGKTVRGCYFWLKQRVPLLSYKIWHPISMQRSAPNFNPNGTSSYCSVKLMMMFVVHVFLKSSRRTEPCSSTNVVMGLKALAT